MKRKLFRLLCCLLAVVAVSGFAACDIVSEILESALGGSQEESSSDDDFWDSSSVRYPQYSFPDSSSKTSSSSKKEEDSSSVVVGGGSSVSSDSASNETSEETSDETSEDVNDTPVDIPSDSTSAFDFTPAPITEKYGYNALASESDGAGMQAFYAELYAEALAFADGKTAKQESGDYTIASVNYENHGISAEESFAVWATFRSDYPEFWWIKNKLTYTSSVLNMLTEASYASPISRAYYDEQIHAMAEDCHSYMPEDEEISLTEAVTTIYDYLISRMDYAYESDGVTPETDVWAYNMIGAAAHNKGVCESYSEAFAWLCGLYGIDCIIVRGYAATDGAGQPHAWNLCSFGDEWITVDATWGDVHYQEKNYINREWLGKSKTEFAQTHTATLPSAAYGVNYQVAMPQIYDGNFTPVLAGEENGEVSWYTSVDAAFTEMQNEQGRYEITLYPDTLVGTKTGIRVYPLGAQFSSTMPKVAHLKLIGKKVYVDQAQTQFWTSTLTYSGVLHLRGDLTTESLKLETTMTIRYHYTLTEN